MTISPKNQKLVTPSESPGRIEFVEDGHIYLYDGVIVPSVSQIIRFELNEFSGVPSQILRNKAKYGTKVHELIESIENGLTLEEINEMRIDPYIKVTLKEYLRIRHEKELKIAHIEKMIGNSHCCGRLDVQLEDGTIGDFKTNREFPKRHLEIQLGFYNYLDGREGKGFCIWLPKGMPGQFIEVDPISNKECEAIIARYEKFNSK